ncbi:MAG: DUF4249 family protein [Bacteroidota bacterium]
MKYWMTKLIFFAFIVLTLSCEENFDPYGDLANRYVLNAIIRGDTTFQTVTLTRSYSAGNFDPYSNTEDPAIKNAIIKLWNGDKVAILKDTTIDPPEGSQYNKPYTVFYTNNFQPDPNSQVEIEAILPNGKRLTSLADVPAQIRIYTSQSSDRIPPTDDNEIKIMWTSEQANPVFIIRVAIYYFKLVDGVRQRNVLTIPVDYVKYGEEYIPNYPKPLSKDNYILNMSTVNQAMELISKDDPNKSNYIILSCIAEVLSLNEELSFYYNATARDRDIYSVKLDETDFSNIENGYGLFGVYMRTYHVMRFSHDYIRSFGYEPGLTDVTINN